jgi:hypothetical protein
LLNIGHKEDDLSAEERKFHCGEVHGIIRAKGFIVELQLLLGDKNPVQLLDNKGRRAAD